MTERAEAWDRIADALEYPAGASSAEQEQYVDAFDLDAASTLDIGWHLFGDAPERGAFLAMLREELARAGVAEGAELPDHLPTLLRLIPREDGKAAAELAALVAPAVVRLRERLSARGHPLADAIDAAADLLATVPRAGEPT